MSDRSALQLTPVADLPLIEPGDDLAGLVLTALSQAAIQLADGDILVLAQKVVSKAEGQHVNLAGVAPSIQAFELASQTGKDPRLVELVLRESKQVLRTRPGVLIVEHRLGFICASAGIDHSNVSPPHGEPGEWVLLLPADPDASARRIRSRIEDVSGVRLGVLIIDSHGRAWRMGTVGVAIGIAGLPALVDMRGWPDLFNFRLQITQVGVADELAAAASLLMGQAAEAIPLVHVRGFPYPLRDGALAELIRPSDQDLFR
jgi:coenzyme F420-0:L-glutamate ligase / coenzyme F420-1:gamma-L-glutamate ligase